MKFYSVYADGNVEWEVVQRDGDRTWICVSTPDQPDYGGIEKAFTSDDILRAVNMAAFWDNRIDECEAWYQSQTPGTIVHYNHSFGQYVRCEIVRLDEDVTMRTGTVLRAGQNVLRPIELVGAWRAHDLPRRQRNGEIHYPYWPEKIVQGGDLFKPDYKCIFEADRERHLAKHADPTGEAAIDLTVPDMTDEERIAAGKWQVIEAIRRFTEYGAGNDPDAILINVGAALGTLPDHR